MRMGVAFEEVWVITGAIDTDRSNSMPSGVSIPEGSFKIIVEQPPGAQTLRVVAFAFPQNPQSNDISTYEVGVDRIEQLIGLDFFPDLPACFETVECAPSNQWITAAGIDRGDKAAGEDAAKAQSSETNGRLLISSTDKTHREVCR